jgi:hypothetical protein
MAVLQISKIQVRRGKENETGVPSLSSGEFAWSVDTQKLFIGNGSVSEGAPAVGNTEIVTFTNDSVGKLFSKIPFYTYGTTITTGVKTPDSPLGTREIFSKLDDIVSASDYGTQGDGLSDDTKALQDAIIKTFLSSDNDLTTSRKPLRIPAGTYVITGTLYIPPFATIEGDGIEKTIIKQATTGTSIFQFVGIDPDALGSGLDRISRLDLGQSHGEDNQAKNIKLSNMTIQYYSGFQQIGAQGMIEADAVLDSEISNVKFYGVVDKTPLHDVVKGINIRSVGGLNGTTTDNLKITDCEFENLYVGINGDYDASNIKILNNKFTYMGSGVALGANLTGSTPQSVGPQHVLIKNNIFSHTHFQAITVTKFDENDLTVQSFVSSVDNTFNDCGNNLSLDLDFDQHHGVISYATGGNTSVNDIFSRSIANNVVVDGPTTLYPTVTGLTYIQNAGAQGVNVPQGPIAQSLLTVAKNTDLYQVLNISYLASQPGVTRRGQVKIICDDTWPLVTEEYSYQGASDGGITFSASLTTATNALTVSITSPSASTLVAFNYNQLY